MCYSKVLKWKSIHSYGYLCHSSKTHPPLKFYNRYRETEKLEKNQTSQQAMQNFVKIFKLYS